MPVPVGFDSDLRLHSDITLWSLLNPFSLLAGLVSLAMILLHGAAWLNLKTEAAVQARARAVMPVAALAFALLFALAGYWLSRLGGYRIDGLLDHGAPSNPLAKTVTHGASWFTAAPLGRAWIVAALVALLGALAAARLRRAPLATFFCSALVPIGTIATARLVLFPVLLPSSSHPQASLTVWDASSSKLTLAIMLGVVVLLLPVVLAYTAWVYRVLRGPVRARDVDSHSY